MDRARILLVPTVTQVEWKIRPLLEEWAEVASFDAPGVGGEPATGEPTPEAIVARGVEEIERQAWRDCVIIGDEAGAPQAVRIAAAKPTATRALVLGHAALTFKAHGPRRTLNGDLFEALIRLARTDYRSFVRALSQITQHAYDDELAERYADRVPQEVGLRYLQNLIPRAGTESLEPTLRSLDVPLLLVQHRGCLGWTAEGYEDAVAAFPEAATGSVEKKASCDPQFAELIREFCEGLVEPTGPPATERAS
jgi:pimeloyl-ACP methyl ester carboxylesterase